MEKTILLCLTDCSEEIEAVATFDLLERSGFQMRGQHQWRWRWLADPSSDFTVCIC